MPLDLPRDEGSDDRGGDDFDGNPFNNIPAYELMNAVMVNDDENGDGGDSDDFGFSSDDEDEPRVVNGQAEANGDLSRYANYELISQEANEERLHESDDDNADNDGHTNEPQQQVNGRLYQHNAVIQWIETDEPLFDRAAFEAMQARRNGDTNGRMTESTTEPQQSTDTTVTVQSTTVHSPDSESTVLPSTSSDTVLPASQSSQPVSTDVKLDSEKIDTIKGLMCNFKLPTESVPTWAKDMQDDQWKSVLDNLIESSKNSAKKD